MTALQVACGSTSSFACMVGGQLCAWGKLKAAGDSTMYPKPYMELGGWTIRHMACGNTTFVCAAHSEDGDSVITWSGSWPLRIPTHVFMIHLILSINLGTSGGANLFGRNRPQSCWDILVLQRHSAMHATCRGQAQHGELGYGANGKKSSANPDKCNALEGVYTHQVRT